MTTFKTYQIKPLRAVRIVNGSERIVFAIHSKPEQRHICNVEFTRIRFEGSFKTEWDYTLVFNPELGGTIYKRTVREPSALFAREIVASELRLEKMTGLLGNPDIRFRAYWKGEQIGWIQCRGRNDWRLQAFSVSPVQSSCEANSLRTLRVILAMKLAEHEKATFEGTFSAIKHGTGASL